MHKYFSRLSAWFAAIRATPAAPDPLSSMSPRELADLPPNHPRCA
ncbi:MAG TPA: hypothetical protein PK286_03415 [Devosia sp.]|nr:hypothetical protein [Devosia sp.]